MLFQCRHSNLTYKRMFVFEQDRAVELQWITELVLTRLMNLPSLMSLPEKEGMPHLFSYNDLYHEPIRERIVVSNLFHTYKIHYSDIEPVAPTSETEAYPLIVILGDFDLRKTFPNLYQQHIENRRTKTLYLTAAAHIVGFHQIKCEIRQIPEVFTEAVQKYTTIDADATIQQQIIAALHQNQGHPLTTAEFIEIVHGHPASIKRELTNLKEAREILKVQHGIYTLPPLDTK